METSSINPPPGAVGSDEWTAIDSKTGKKMSDEKALTLTDAEVDWLKNDGKQWTYDSEHDDYLLFKNKNSDGSGGVDTSFGTKVYDPGHPEADAEGLRDDATTTSVDNDNHGQNGPNINTATPFGVLDSKGKPQGWTATDSNGDAIPEGQISQGDPTRITWTNSDGTRKIQWDPAKNAWKQTGGGADQYYDPRHQTDPDKYTATGGNASGWNGIAHYNRYQSDVAAPAGVFNDNSTTGTQDWNATNSKGPLSPEQALNEPDPKTITWTSKDGTQKIQWDPVKNAWKKTVGGADQYYDPRHQTDPDKYATTGGDASGWNGIAHYNKFQKNNT